MVDVQNDFLPGGPLPVPKGEEIIPILNDYIKIFNKINGKIFATRDWHPPNHASFIKNGGIWPEHCIRETEGAKFHPGLNLPENIILISKATDPYKEAYSGFEDTNLLKKLEKEQINRVFIGGLATDYCVKNTVLDALKFRFKTFFLMDGSRGINSTSGEIKRAVELMLINGAKKVVLLNFFL